MPHRAATERLPQSRYYALRSYGPAPQPAAAVKGGNILREQILMQPEGYIGSLEKRTQKLWVFEDVFAKECVVTYIPGLLKIFDEVLVYAADNKQRDPSMDTLRVDVDVAKGCISVFNSGKGIPIELHGEKGIYVPEVIFGHLSSCCDPKVVEERNSYGVKLANIFSTEFVVETADGPGQKKYKQVFSENMGKKLEPEITCYRKGKNWSWTMVTFKPDLAKFNLACVGEDHLALMRKRVFDMAGILGGTVQVVFNGRNLTMRKGLFNYVYRHVMPLSEDTTFCSIPRFFLKVDRWEVSFVNNFATISGGTHVDYVSNLIVASFMKSINCIYHIEEHDVKRHLMVFVKVVMENPTFSSPTKEALTTPQADFASDLKLPNRFLARVHSALSRKLRNAM